MATGTPSRFAQALKLSQAALFQLPPPANTIGFLAFANCFIASEKITLSNPG